MSYGTTQRYRIENLLCLTCAKPLPPGTKILFCSECATTKKKQQSTLIAARKELELCIVCGKAKPYTGTKCEACTTRNAVYQKRAREKRIPTGMCIECGKRPPLDSFKENAQYRACEECYLQIVSRKNLGSRKFWSILKQKLIEQDFTCPYTGEYLILGVNDSLDHIYPISRFPELAKDVANVEWIARKINRMKNDLTPDEFIALMRHIIQYRENNE